MNQFSNNTKEQKIVSAYRKHLKKCSPINEEDHRIDEETYKWIRSLVDEDYQFSHEK